jgi:hypothetical protein
MPTITDAPVKVESKEVSFGDGKYSSAMKELFKDAQRLLSLNATDAEKLARAYGAELGRYNLNSKITFGKYSAKSNSITLKESASLKGLVVTYPIALAKLCINLQECRSFGFDQESIIVLQKNYVDWLKK